MSSATAPGLTIVALGVTTPAHVAHLIELFARVEQIDVSPDAPPTSAVNQAVDAAANDWILLLRSNEVVDAILAQELRAAVTAPARAWAFRLRTEVIYCGSPLRIGEKSEGEVRLFHRRHCRVTSIDGEIGVKLQGSVVRLSSRLRTSTFANAAEHQEALMRSGTKRGLVARLLFFGREVIAGGLLFRGRSTLGYVWREAGYRVESGSETSRGN